MRNLQDWIEYIQLIHPKTIDLSLDRIALLAEKLQLNCFNCPVITVAGTNGKGSVIACLESIFVASGYQVAAYTSPHLLRFNERLRFNKQEVSDQQFIEAFAFIEAHRHDIELTFFEFTTLAALKICQQLDLSVLLLEVGLGGRLDAVNIVDPDIAVITNIDLDHMDWLGDTREKIGFEKAGIIRAKRPVVCGDPEPPKSVLSKANAVAASCFTLNHQFFYRQRLGGWDWHGGNKAYTDLPLPALKLQNVATSLMVIELLQAQLPVLVSAIRASLAHLKLAGRFQQVDYVTPVVMDVAHNPQSIAYLAQQLGQLPAVKRTVAVLGMLKNKDIVGSLHTIAAQIDAWYIGDLSTSRGATVQYLAGMLKQLGVGCIHECSTVTEAFEQAVRNTDAAERIVVFGSFYTVGLVQDLLIAKGVM